MRVADMAEATSGPNDAGAPDAVRVQFIHQQFQMFGSRSATSADNRNVMLGHEFIKIIRERFRLERINGLTIHVERKPGVGDARNRKRGLFAEDADGFAHVLGSGGAVEADDINAHAFEDGKRGRHSCRATCARWYRA